MAAGCLVATLLATLLAPRLEAQDQFPDLDLRVACDAGILGVPGQTAVFDASVMLSTRSNPGPQGVQGWSLSLAPRGASRIVDATTVGTVGARSPAGLRIDGFERTELTVSNPNAEPPRLDNDGAVSAVVLSFVEPITLPREGEAMILRLRAEAEVPASGCSEVGIELEDGRQGNGQPVVNIVTFGGNSRRDDGGEADNDRDGPENCTIQVCTGTFLRGDCDATGQINLTDAVFALNHLFLGGDAPSCFKACDPNDDAVLNLTDPIFLLNYLFLGGRPPMAPFPTCGSDPTPDDMSCLPHPRCV